MSQSNCRVGLLAAAPSRGSTPDSERSQKVKEYSTKTMGYGEIDGASPAVSGRSLTSTLQGAAGRPERSLTGRTISHYRILDKLGNGGMGVIYRAQDVRLGRYVAMKFAYKKFRADPTICECLRREASVGSALNHPNVCAVYDVGGFAGRPFVVMELLEGRTLRNAMGMGFGLEMFFDLGTQICDGLEAMHAIGIVHRDIKPSNIFVTTTGQAKVFDFGLAIRSSEPVPQGPTRRDPRRGSVRAEQGTVLGTPAYMSPEQVRGEQLDGRSDLFSFGVLLYELLTGARPFQGVTIPSVLDAVLRRPFVPIPLLKPGLPAGVQQLVEKALEKDREFRYQSAADLCADMKRLQRDLEHARPGRGIRVVMADSQRTGGTQAQHPRCRT
jgi:eukaryotic-like serine/threonine-protein kinase